MSTESRFGPWKGTANLIAHSRYVERYLEKLARRLGCPYKGAIIKRSAAGIREAPAWMTRKAFKALDEMGRTYGQTGEFDRQLTRRLAQCERMGRLNFQLYRMVSLWFWNNQLKKTMPLSRGSL